MNLPHERCNFLFDQDDSVLVGAKPNDTTLPLLLDWGVSIFINLTDDEEGAWYADLLPRNVLMASGTRRSPITPCFPFGDWNWQAV